jgi:hypothetical protein
MSASLSDCSLTAVSLQLLQISDKNACKKHSDSVKEAGHAAATPSMHKATQTKAFGKLRTRQAAGR